MKLTEDQKTLLAKHDWDLVENDEGNCSWVSISSEDGSIFGEVCDSFGLTGETGELKLLVIGTIEE